MVCGLGNNTESVAIEIQADGARSVLSSVGGIDCGNSNTACKALSTDTEAPSAATSVYGSVATLSSVELGIGKAIDNLATASALKYEVFVSTDKALLFDNTSLVTVLDGSPDGGELAYEVNDLTSGVAYFFGVIAVDPAFNKSSPATISSFYLLTELCEIASFEHFVEWEGFTLTGLTDNQYTYVMTNSAISPSVGDIIVKRINATDDQPHDIQNVTHIFIHLGIAVFCIITSYNS